MRPVSEWEELDILALIESGTQESNALHYKACDALRATSDHSIDRVKSEVSKDVSGIANAAGGLLVYGIKEAHHVPVELSEGVVSAADCVLIATDHGAYDYDWIVHNARLVVDTRNATRSVVHDRQKIVKV